MTDWTNWLAQWDRQQEVYRPGRDAALGALSAIATRFGPNDPNVVLDLACGCGSVTSRVLQQDAALRVVAVDRDPVLLRIARGVFANEDRVVFVEADLRDSKWMRAIDGRQFRAVVSAASLHWLPQETLSRLYRDLATLIPAGGAFANLDWIPTSASPALADFSEREVRRHEEDQLARGAGLSWREWWARLREDPALREAFAERDALPDTRSAEFIASEGWHSAQLAAAGFSEVGVVWRWYTSAIIVAVR